MVQRQARQVAVLQVLELLHEHGRAQLAVAVDQREARLRLGGEHRLHDREDRRDAAAAGDAEVVARGARIERHEEAALRRHHLDACRRPCSVSWSQVENAPPGTLRMPTRSSPSATPAQIEYERRSLAAGDASRAASGAGPGVKRNCSAELGGHVERDDHRLVGLGADALARAADGSGAPWARSDRLEVLERLAAGAAAPERLAGGRAEGGEPLGVRAARSAGRRASATVRGTKRTRRRAPDRHGPGGAMP